MPKFTDTEPDLKSIPTDKELENLSLSQLREMRKTYKLKTGDKKQQIILALSQFRIQRTPSPEPESFAQLVARDFPIPQPRFDYYDPPSIPAGDRQSSPPVTYNHGSSPTRPSFSAFSEDEDRVVSNPTGRRKQQVYKTVRQIRLTAQDGRPLISARVVKELDDASALVAIGPPPIVYDDPYDTDTEITPPPIPSVVKREPLGCITKQFLQVEDIEYEEVENARPSSQLSIMDPLHESDIIAEEKLNGLDEGGDDHKDETTDKNQDREPYNEEWENYTDEENDENIPPSAQCKFVPCRKEFLVRVSLSNAERLRSDRPSAQKTIGLLVGLIKE
ncbi:hypothetical protein BJ165DRAFT_1598664 [Panaeolus papilionaceus]|nr:hypothetical protein BJ165DRAFT_1598664 [Panaeolus papilionaceus]